MPAYHLAIANQAQGPFSEQEVRTRLAAGEVGADTLVSMDGGAWAPLAQALPWMSAAAAAPASVNPYSPPAAQIIAASGPTARSYGGIGRLLYLLAIIGCFFVIGVFAPLFPRNGVVINFVNMALFLIPSCFRFKNIGRHPAWCVLLFVPVLGLFITLPCFILPEGYQDHRKLDLPAKILGGLFLAGLIGSAVAAFYWMMNQ